ncbi:diguanylate cyclase domain-containing protein, partial [Clostridium chrysemydis]
DDCIKFRMGGDEFMIIIKNSSEEYVKSKIDELDRVIEDSNKNSDIIVSLSKGYSICKKTGEDIVRVMDKADYYMYRDKRSKR